MADEPEIKPGETVVEQPNGSEAPGEAAPGTVAPDAQARAAQEREDFLNEIVARVAEKIRPAAPAPAPPPTTAAGPLADLEREAQAIAAEEAALTRESQQVGGWTADMLVRRQDLTDRKSNWRAEATLRAIRLQEAQTRVEKAGEEPGWLKYYEANRHRGDVEILRAAWEHDQMKAAPPSPTPAPQPKLTERAPAPNVSGPAEVTATERKARTMTREQVQATKAKLEEEGKFKEIRELDASLRNGDVLLKT